MVLLDENRAPVWDQVVAEPPKPSRDLRPDASRPVEFSLAVADLEAPGFEASLVLGNPDPSKKGWSPGRRRDRPAHLTLVPRQPFQVGPGSNLVVTLEPRAAKEPAGPIAFWAQAALLLFLAPVIHAVHFYLVHRLLHWRPLYRRVHHIHHVAKAKTIEDGGMRLRPPSRHTY